MISIDLNCDLGEGFGPWKMGDDAALLGIVTSASVACGFHAGDPLTMDRTVAAATAHGVRIGAHVSYHDLRGFGRRHVEVGADELAADVLYQIGALDALAVGRGGRVSYVKAHGALYNESAAEPGLAATFVAAVAAYRVALPVVCPPGSEVAAAAARAGLRVVREGFADRSYQRDGRLSPRGRAGAVIADPELVGIRAARLAVEGRVEDADGGELALEVDTICVHGDTPGAVENARSVRRCLEQAGVRLAPFAG